MKHVPSKVSVIVPVYNVEKYLSKCLDSLISQSYQNLEILVVNDGSTDCSEDIIRNYAQRYPDSIKAFQKENGGLSDARNFGIDRATGDYIGFVDSDDYVSPVMFEEMTVLAEKHCAEMVICNVLKVDEHGNIRQKLIQVPEMPEKIDLENNFSVFSDISYFACNKLFKKVFLMKKRFKENVHFEDIQLIPQLLLDCTTVAQTQNFHYHYLERTDSISKTHTEKGLDILRAVEEVEEYFKTTKYSDKVGELKNFQIFEGVYSFIAYLAFVKNDEVFYKMCEKLEFFMNKRDIKLKNLLQFNRFGKNYLLSLSLKKKHILSFIFCRAEKTDKKIYIKTQM